MSTFTSMAAIFLSKRVPTFFPKWLLVSFRKKHVWRKMIHVNWSLYSFNLKWNLIWALTQLFLALWGNSNGASQNQYSRLNNLFYRLTLSLVKRQRDSPFCYLSYAWICIWFSLENLYWSGQMADYSLVTQNTWSQQWLSNYLTK